MVLIMRQISRYFILAVFVLTLQGCSISGTFYLINNSQNPWNVKISLNHLYSNIYEHHIVRIADYDGKKIKYSTFKTMDKRTIRVDTLNKKLEFKLSPSEFAFIGQGSNSRLGIVHELSLENNNEHIIIDPMKEGEFEIKSGGFLKFTALRFIE